MYFKCFLNNFFPFLFQNEAKKGGKYLKKQILTRKRGVKYQFVEQNMQQAPPKQTWAFNGATQARLTR